MDTKDVKRELMAKLYNRDKPVIVAVDPTPVAVEEKKEVKKVIKKKKV